MSNVNNTEAIYVNKKYKDRLFKLVFKEKKDLLELYNAINDTDYDNPDDIEINTIEDVVYMGMNKENAAIQCRAVVLNVNLGYNKRIMERCKMLKEYAQYIACVRVYLENGYSIENAIDVATDECIKNGILEQILRDNRGEVRSMILTEYDEQAHIEYEKEISYEEGKTEGREEGRECILKLIQVLLSAGRVDDIDKVTKDKTYCNQLMQEFKIE